MSQPSISDTISLLKAAAQYKHNDQNNDAKSSRAQFDGSVLATNLANALIVLGISADDISYEDDGVEHFYIYDDTGYAILIVTSDGIYLPGGDVLKLSDDFDINNRTIGKKISPAEADSPSRYPARADSRSAQPQERTPWTWASAASGPITLPDPSRVILLATDGQSYAVAGNCVTKPGVINASPVLPSRFFMAGEGAGLLPAARKFSTAVPAFEEQRLKSERGNWRAKGESIFSTCVHRISNVILEKTGRQDHLFFAFLNGSFNRSTPYFLKGSKNYEQFRKNCECTKVAVQNSLNKTCYFPAVFFWQGQSDFNLNVPRWSYKAALKDYKTQRQTIVREVFNQDEPLKIIYMGIDRASSLNSWFPNEIDLAALELSDEDPDFIYAGPGGWIHGMGHPTNYGYVQAGVSYAHAWLNVVTGAGHTPMRARQVRMVSDLVAEIELETAYDWASAATFEAVIDDAYALSGAHLPNHGIAARSGEQLADLEFALSLAPRRLSGNAVSSANRALRLTFSTPPGRNLRIIGSGRRVGANPDSKRICSIRDASPIVDVGLPDGLIAGPNWLSPFDLH